jgi:hypothetical protein
VAIDANIDRTRRDDLSTGRPVASVSVGSMPVAIHRPFPRNLDYPARTSIIEKKKARAYPQVEGRGLPVVARRMVRMLDSRL